MELHLVHIPKIELKHSVDCSGMGDLVFETCMRKIVFLSSENCLKNDDLSSLVKQQPEVEIFSSAQAYRFVLEVICGLHSLIKGETEIFGQFKAFMSEFRCQIEAQGLAPVFQQLLTDCKSLRCSQIQHWSHNTYGSVTRKLLNSDDGVAVIGAGQLAQEIAPWLKHVATKKVILRRPRNLSYLFSEFQTEVIGALKPSQSVTVLVIAANITNSDLVPHLQFWPNLRMIVDWRGDEKWIRQKEEDVFHLHDLKQNDEAAKLEQNRRIQSVCADIQIKALEFIKKTKHNPWGWEDFCA